MACDPYWNQVVLALHMDGTNGSTTFTDVTGKTVTANGNAQISTAQSKFGGASGYFDGSGDYASVASSTDFKFATGDFTAELWVRRPALTTGNILDVRPVGGGTGNYWAIYFPSTTEISLYASGADRIRTTHGMVVDTWYHIAVCRASGTTRLFLNGTQLGSSYTDGTSYLVAPVILCASAHTLTDAFVNAYIDDLRITKGVARYTANFTPPAAPFPNQLPVISGVVKDASGNLAERLVRAYLRSSGVLLGQTLSNPATGGYAIPVESDKECFVVSHDSSANPPSGGTENAVILDRVIPI